MSELTRRQLFGAAITSLVVAGPNTNHAVALAPQDPPGPMDPVLLKDYRPVTSLVVPITRTPKARYGAIDVHSHAYAGSAAEVKEWVRTKDAVGVERTVVLTGATGERFDALVAAYLTPYPSRFQLYCGISTANYEAPDYPQRAVAELVRCYSKGARGVGEITDKGSGIAGGDLRPRARRLHIDDARLDPVWEKCAELRIPVNVHLADHPSCWQPPDERQERVPAFQRFNQYGRDVPTHAELLLKRDRLLAKHPRTTFIFCHLSNQGHDLAALSKVLERFPNLYLDIAARDYEVGRQPRAAAKFLARHRDRVLWGTDQGLEQAMYEAWWRLLQTDDEFIEGSNWWRHYGLGLPDGVLKRMYQDNARKLLNWEA